MKYSEALRKSVEFRKKYPTFSIDHYHCPLCGEVERRCRREGMMRGVCSGCPLYHMEPIYRSFLEGKNCVRMALGINNGNKEIERLILELALAYELAGD